jgi:hypothetical protein
VTSFIESALSLIAQSSLAFLLVLLAIWLCRKLIEARLTRSVQHEFDVKLATFNKELQEETRRVEAVRSAGFAALSAQRTSLATKRVEAAQGLWNGLLDARMGVGVAGYLEILNVQAVVAEAHNPKMQLVLKSMVSEEVMSNEYASRLSGYSAHQPFVSPIAWALFVAYSTIISFSIAQMQLIRLGYDPHRFLRATHWSSLLGAALPAEDFKKIGTSSEFGVQWALKRIEELFVDELRLSMAGESAGVAGVEDARRILEAADKLQNSASKAQEEFKSAKV